MAGARARLALVTGGTSGIGLSVAKMLASRGCEVVINGRGEARAVVAAAVQECKAAGAASGVDVHFYGADLSEPARIDDLFAFVRRQCARTPDILINNAGIQHVAPVEAFPVDKWEGLLRVNLTAAFHTTRLALGGMRVQGWGRIVNMASVHGLVASAHKAAYCASKFGLVGLTKVVALETAGSGITCNAVCPALVFTTLVVPQIEAIAKEEGVSFDEGKALLLAAKQPSKQFVSPDEVAALVSYLCSEEAAQVTGVAVPIDGGLTAA